VDEEAPQKERLKLSEWNRTIDKFAWINDAERRIQENLTNMIRAGGYSLVDEYLMLIEICFINFEGDCKEKEVKEFYSLRDECRIIRDEVARQAVGWQNSGREKREGLYRMRREQIDKLTSFFRLLCKCQSKHGLGIKTTTRSTYADQEKNVLTEG